MAEIPKDMRSLLFVRGAKWGALWLWVYLFLGFACLIIGIIGDVTSKKLGLQPTNWFIIFVGFWLAAFWSWIMAYFAAKEG